VAIIWDALVRPDDLTTFVRNVPVNQQYVLDSLFPNVTVNDVEVDIKDVTVTQRTAKFRAFDAPPAPGERDTYTRKAVKLPAVSQMLGQGELDRLRQLTAAARGGSDSAVIQAIYDDAENNTRSVQNRVELARGDLLTDGKVTLTELGSGIEADFGVPGGHIVTAGTLWSSTSTATPLADLRAWSATYRATNGFRPGGMVMSETVLYYLLDNTNIRGLFAANGVTPSLLDPSSLDALLRKYNLPPITLIYDAQVAVDGVTTSILPANKVWFTPPAGVRLGRTVWGLTTTGSALAARGMQIMNGPEGIVGVVDEDARPPYRQAVYVDATCLPVLDNPRALFIATIA
jgi:hypothetical protein